MPLVLQYNDGDAEVLVWRISEPVELLSQMVPADCAAYARDNFVSVERCSQWLAVRAILRQRFGDGVRVVYDGNGKPSLNGCYENISISHTKGYAVLVVSQGGEVGVDAELLSRDVLAVARRFMPLEQLDTYCPAERNFVALVNWCAREALFKITGDLGGNFKENISVAPFEPLDKGRVKLSLVGLDDCADVDFLAAYRLYGDLLILLCRRCRDVG